MGRKPRIEFPGATYHVFNRGGGPSGPFDSAAAARVFSDLIWEACGRMRWRLHAYALIRDGYHLVLSTPKGNLPSGIHWLQSAFGNRFQRFHGRERRAFRSRYRAILVEPGASLAQVVDFVHLLPVTAGLVGFPQLAHFRWSSYRRFVRDRADRPEALSCAEWLSAHGLDDASDGWRDYASRLEALSADEGLRTRAGFGGMCRGWAIGSEEFRRDFTRRLPGMAASADWGGVELAAANRDEWRECLETGARRLGRDLASAPLEAKAAPWKVALAAWLKAGTSATNPWITQRLAMGPADAVSRYIGEVRRGLRPEALGLMPMLGAVR
jgi:hypothetical protein